MYGPSGLLRDRIVKGEPAEVFASANMAHPESLAKTGKAAPVVLFARNRLCALAAPASRCNERERCSIGCSIRRSSWGPRRRRPIRPATTPGNCSRRRAPPARRRQSASARKRCSSPAGRARRRRPRTGASTGVLVSSGQADRLSHVLHQRAAGEGAKRRRSRSCRFPRELAVGADYGLTVIAGARPDADRFAQFVLSGAGQAILVRHGFAAATQAKDSR